MPHVLQRACQRGPAILAVMHKAFVTSDLRSQPESVAREIGDGRGRFGRQNRPVEGQERHVRRQATGDGLQGSKEQEQSGHGWRLTFQGHEVAMVGGPRWLPTKPRSYWRENCTQTRGRKSTMYAKRFGFPGQRSIDTCDCSCPHRQCCHSLVLRDASRNA